MAASNLSKYIGRTIDVLAWRGGTARDDVLLDQSIMDEDSTGEICTGVQKLVQRFLITLLNEKGSIKYKPTIGTNFMQEIRLGRVRTETDIQGIFSLAELATKEQMLAEELATDPADERYKQTVLAGITLSPGFVSLTLQLSSQSEAVEFILPISIVV
jgi:hypothetical protein